MKTSIAAVAAAAIIAATAAAEAATVYATDVHVDVGSGQNRNDADRFGPDNALGAANGDFYSLGLGGSALFTFGADILGPGTIFEVTFNCALQQSGTCSYAETARIFGIAGPVDLAAREDGVVSGVQNYDLAGLGGTLLADIPNGSAQGGFAFDTGGQRFWGLLVVDTSPFVRGRDGFDVASIEATPAPVPLPPAAALLLGAFGGLGLVRRRTA